MVHHAESSGGAAGFNERLSTEGNVRQLQCCTSLWDLERWRVLVSRAAHCGWILCAAPPVRGWQQARPRRRNRSRATCGASAARLQCDACNTCCRRLQLTAHALERGATSVQLRSLARQKSWGSLHHCLDNACPVFQPAILAGRALARRLLHVQLARFQGPTSALLPADGLLLADVCQSQCCASASCMQDRQTDHSCS